MCAYKKERVVDKLQICMRFLIVYSLVQILFFGTVSVHFSHCDCKKFRRRWPTFLLSPHTRKKIFTVLYFQKVFKRTRNVGPELKLLSPDNDKNIWWNLEWFLYFNRDGNIAVMKIMNNESCKRSQISRTSI